jgi:organic hydroperoxide reductase OsmC/OhrA
MSTIKALRFPVRARWQGDRKIIVGARELAELRVAPPPGLRGGTADCWSPEELLVGAVASCFAITLVAVAEHLELPLHALEVAGTGHLSGRGDGRFGFVAIDVDVTLDVPPETAQLVHEAIELTKERCIVSAALDTPVHVGVTIAAREEVTTR